MSGDATALVTGGTGHLGGRLLQTLLQEGWAVRTCGRRPRPPELPEAVDYHQVDLAAGAPLDPLVQGVDVVFHTAAGSSSTATPEQMETINVAGTARLAEAAHEARVSRFVHISTSSVYGRKVLLPQPIVEDAECHPGAGYAETKWRAEQALGNLIDKGLAGVVVRPVTIFGPGAVKLVASTILDAAVERFDGMATFVLRREPVELRLVHVDDVVAACLHVATEAAAVGGIFNLDCGAYPTQHEVGHAVADALGLEVELSDDADPGPSYGHRAAVHERMLAAGMRDDIVLTTERVRFLNKANPNNRLSLEALRRVGFRPRVTDIHAAIHDNVEWYSARRWIL